MVSKHTSGSKRTHRSHSGYMQGEIVKLLQKKDNEHMRFTDLREALGISKPVLSQHLDNLEKEKTIVSMKKGREKHYMLSKNAFKILERHVSIFSSNYTEFFIDDLMLREYVDAEELYYEFSQRMSAMLFFTILKSIETGQDWTKAIDIQQFISTALFLIPNFIDRENQPFELTDAIADNDFKNIKRIMDKIYKNKTRYSLKPLYETLRRIYPREFEVMDYSYKKPQAEWSKHYEEMYKKK